MRFTVEGRAGLDYLHRVYWRLYDLPGWGEANWHAREDVAALMIRAVNEMWKKADVFRRLNDLE